MPFSLARKAASTRYDIVAGIGNDDHAVIGRDTVIIDDMAADLVGVFHQVAFGDVKSAGDAGFQQRGIIGDGGGAPEGVFNDQMGMARAQSIDQTSPLRHVGAPKWQLS